jgi:hypothetical protein
MKLHVPPGPLPIAPPYFDWDDEEDLDLIEDEQEIDLTDLFDRPKIDEPKDVESLN